MSIKSQKHVVKL